MALGCGRLQGLRPGRPRFGRAELHRGRTPRWWRLALTDAAADLSQRSAAGVGLKLGAFAVEPRCCSSTSRSAHSTAELNRYDAQEVIQRCTEADDVLSPVLKRGAAPR